MENPGFLMFFFFYLFGVYWAFCPNTYFFGRTNHTNLTRRIDPRHPEPPNSPIPPKRAFSFFRFLGFRGGRVSGGMVQGTSRGVGGTVQGRGGLERGSSRKWGRALLVRGHQAAVLGD